MRNKAMISIMHSYSEACSMLIESLSKNPRNIDAGYVKEVLDIIGEQCDNSFNKYLEMARIVSDDIALGKTSVVATLLYGSVKEGILTPKYVKEKYGGESLQIVEGLMRILDFDVHNPEAQAENHRKLLLNLATDLRVILIKLAEQLYRMRILDGASDKYLKDATEAIYLYAPLAHRLGLYIIKSEMEDISLKLTEYSTYKDIARRLNETASERNKFISEFIAPIKEQLEKENVKCEVTGRPKSIYSIWKKMKAQNIGFDEVYDKFAIRVIIDSKPESEKSDCWKAYSIVTDIYQPNTNRLRDWISVPKTNGYESLHTTVVVPGGKWVEVQIRSERMNEIAEKGFAAHWKYKGNKKESNLDDWLAKVRDILENPNTDARSVIDDFKLSLYAKEIFVFTPKGDLKKFPKKATVLDFAYEIHSDVGNTCAGAKVNGRIVPLRHILENGDKVEIITSKTQKPNTDWLNYVATSRAKSKIRTVLNEVKKQNSEEGKEILKRRFKNWKVEFNDANTNLLLKYFNLKNTAEMYSRIASGKIDLTESKHILSDTKTDKPEPPQPEIKPDIYRDVIDKLSASGNYLVIDDKLDNVVYKLGKCCNPVYGDDIFGFITIGGGIKIHRINCPNSYRLLSRYGYRSIKARWKSTNSVSNFATEIQFTGIDSHGGVTQITEIVSSEPNASSRSMQIDNHDGIFEGRIKVMVKDKDILESLISRIQNVPGILKVYRKGGL